MASAEPEKDSSLPTARHLSLLDLPEETLREILDYCETSELICLALVSKRFHRLASEALYHCLHFTLPYHGNKLGEDTLAACLNTFTTSEYDYAKHVREFCVDSYGSGSDADRIIGSYVYTESCGKFLNNLLYLTLRKATGLETFLWDVRIELSRPIYKILHQIDTLSDIQIRLQKGPSMYESLPPLPLSPSSSSSSSAISTPIDHGLSFAPSMSFQQPALNPFTVPASGSLFYTPSLPIVSPAPLPKPTSRAKVSKRGPHQAEPPTISGFKNLKDLSILDIDSLDMISEIKTCIRNSSGTLTGLGLSFSSALANKARKPARDVDSDESDVDNISSFNVPVNVTMADGSLTTDDSPSSSKHLHAQEEKQRQDTALSRIFDLESLVIRSQTKKSSTSADKKAGSSASNTNGASEGQNGDSFIKAIRDLSEHLMASTSGSRNYTTEQQKALDIIEAAARKYVASEAEGADKKADDKATGSKEAEPAADDADKASPSEASLFRDDDTGTRAKTRATEISPEDIDVEEPEGQLILDEGSASDKEGDPETQVDVTASEPEQNQKSLSNGLATEPTSREQRQETLADKKDADNANLAVNISAQRKNFEALLEKLATLENRAQQAQKSIGNLNYATGAMDEQTLAEIEKQEQALHRDVRCLSEEARVVAAEVRDIGTEMERMLAAEKKARAASAASSPATATAGKEHKQRLVDTYVRSTRGLALEDLELCLIPVKASVLSRAIDLRVLKRIALLNVGPQAPIWTLFSKENQVQPLPLMSIFTDNVSMAFLNFVGQLNEVKTLLMLEQDPKNKPERLAPKTTTTIEEIRHIVLKKHAPHLKRLMLNNGASQDWDLDEATVKLLSQRAKNLTELSASMNMRSIHKFLRRLPGFVSLEALHIIQLRNDDTCVWVMQETKRFLLDTLTHYPHLKLEWLAIDNSVTVDHIKRVVVKKKKKQRKQKEKKKSATYKGKEKATNGSHQVGPPIPGLAALNAYTSASFNGTNGSVNDSLASKAIDEDSSGESDSSASGQYKRVKLVTESCHIPDVWSVHIFDKVVMGGRL